jgi:hypothetical protein
MSILEGQVHLHHAQAVHWVQSVLIRCQHFLARVHQTLGMSPQGSPVQVLLSLKLCKPFGKTLGDYTLSAAVARFQ